MFTALISNKQNRFILAEKKIVLKTNRVRQHCSEVRGDCEAGEGLKEKKIEDAVESVNLRQEYDANHDEFGVKNEPPEIKSIE